MTLETLKLKNFRSYKEEEFEFHPEKTVIIGPNGSGKTNILEAIYTLSMTKSFRGKPADMAHKDGDWFRIEAQLDNKESIALAWKDNQKKITYKEDTLTPHEYLGTFPVVLFEPDHLLMIKGAPLLRRQWLNRILSFSDKQYLHALLHYQRGLKQRNALLRDPRTKKDQIFAWDMILSEHAEYIVSSRQEFMEDIKPDFKRNYHDISKSKDTLEIAYKTHGEIKDGSYRDSYIELLQQRLERDRRFGSTSVGPHRDDIDIRYNDHPLSQYGSRGEGRTAVLSLILCELGYLRKTLEVAPILLLDDVLSELDEDRQQALLGSINETQIVITSTHTLEEIGSHTTISL